MITFAAYLAVLWVGIIAALYVLGGIITTAGSFARWYFTLGYFARVGVIMMGLGVLTLGYLSV